MYDTTVANAAPELGHENLEHGQPELFAEGRPVTEAWLGEAWNLVVGNRERRRAAHARLRIRPDRECSHSWRWNGHAPENWQLGDECENWATLKCVGCEGEIAIRCGATSCSTCKPCGERYRKRVRTVAGSRWRRVPGGSVVFATFTAPGDRAHCRRHRDCEGIGPNCDQCPCTPVGGVDIGRWNATGTSRFDDLRTNLRNRHGDQLQTFRAAEVQERGALHYHVLIARDDGSDLVLDVKELRELAIRHGFGHEVDVQVVTEPERTIGYVAKYVSKAVDARKSLPWLDRRTGERQEGNGRYRCWTASRRWGSSMREVVAAQEAWKVAGAHEAGGPPGREPGVPAVGPAEPAPLDPKTERSEPPPPTLPELNH